VQREDEDAADLDGVAWLFSAPAVNPDMAGVDQCLGECPALRQADAV